MNNTHITTIRRDALARNFIDKCVVCDASEYHSESRSGDKFRHPSGCLNALPHDDRLTGVTAKVGRAPVIRAHDGVSVVYRGVLVGAIVVRAERLAALLFVALAAVTLDVSGVLDQRVTLGAFHGVAVLLLHWPSEMSKRLLKAS